MNEFIITSEIDPNYFVVSNGVGSISVLSSMLMKNDIEASNVLLSIITMPEIRNNLIFIEKSSKLGLAINDLIKNKKIIDANEIIEEKHLINALINQNLYPNNLEYLNTITQIIKDKRIGKIEKLKRFYDEKYLKQINKDARIIWHYSYDKQYYKEISLTGYEENGITFLHDKWHYIDIIRKETTPIEPEDTKTKIKQKY